MRGFFSFQAISKQTFPAILLSLLLTSASQFNIGCSGQGNSPHGGGQAPAITTQPVNQTAIAGQTATFSVVASGAAPLSYQWERNGANIAGATSSSYTTPSTIAADNGSKFLVVVRNSAGTATSNAATLTVTADTTSPTVSITAPTAGTTVSGLVTVSANASDNVGVASVQFQLDGVNLGTLQTASPYSTSWDTTTASNGSHTLAALAKDATGNSATSSGVTVTVSNVAATGMGPLVQSATNSHYFVNPAGQAVLLAGTHTWNDFQDTDTSTSPAAFDFNGYVSFLKSHGHNATILWRKDLPTYCNWGAGGTWQMSPFPWKRTGGASGTQKASDGLPTFDLTQLDQTYFDRLRSRVILLQQNGIYAIIELFDGLGLADNRCPNDGYPFTLVNNVNGVDDGGGTNSMTMTSPNAITGYQDAYVQKVIDTLNDLPNVLWEPSEEAPDNSTWWQGHMISLIRSYEAGKPLQHPIGYATLNVTNTSDSNLYNSGADWVAPMSRLSPTSSCGSGVPACKVNINDSDHSYFGMWNDTAQTNRNYVWENFTNGNQVMFMDPYLILWSSGNRNLCQSPLNGVCSAPDSRWNNMRDNLGYIINYANRMDLLKMTPQGNLSSTGFCLADNVATGAEYLVYAPNGGSFTLNLSVTTRVLNVEWFDPSGGTTVPGSTVTGGSTINFTPPFTGDAVLYLVDAAGHN